MSYESIGSWHARGRNNFHLIRLLAALAVIYGHAYAIAAGGGADLYLRYVGNKFIGGVAVDIFFVVSGFLIAASLQRNSLARYAWSRMLRIFPALVVAVLASVFVLGPLLTTSDSYWSDGRTWAYLYNNALMIRTEYFLPGVFETNPNSAVNGSLWSLPVEFRLYVVFFVIAAIGLLRTSRFFPTCLVLLMVGLVVVPQYPIFTEYRNWVNSTIFFFAGALVWMHRDEIRLSPWGVLAVLLACVALRGSAGFTTAYMVALVYLVFYVAYAVRLPVIRRTDISYGVYLYGWPVQQTLVHFDPTMSALTNTWASCLITAAIAWVSWTVVEKPMLSLKPRFGSGKRKESAVSDPHRAEPPESRSPMAADPIESAATGSERTQSSNSTSV